VYSFRTQLEIGQRYEKLLDDYFEAEGYSLIVVPMELQRLGIDRIISKGGKTSSVEYKTDFTAMRTGNAFLETEVAGKPGWALKSIAQIIVYWIPPDVYFLDMAAIKSRSYESYPLSPPIQNEGFVARGILVPIEKLPILAKIKLEAE
jgi:hypothetical protein